MILYNVRLAGRQGSWFIQIKNGTISLVTENEKDCEPDELIEFEADLCLAGFINSHDHLDFNLFPQLGDRVYSNYAEWGPSIQKNHKERIERVLKVPEKIRSSWGLYKNLLNGFTTVVHHGNKIKVDTGLIDIYHDYFPLHSPQFEKNWVWKLNNPFRRGKPFVMHLGEGIDEAAKKEIERVIRFNVFKKQIIAIHGIQMDARQIRAFHGLVWCPASNYFLFDQTIGNEILKNYPVVFGTDSTLTSPWNAWEHFRIAIQKRKRNEMELLHNLGSYADRLWNFNDRGEIFQGRKADIIILNKTDKIFDSNPTDILLIIKNGEVKLFDEKFSSRLRFANKDYSKITFGGSVKYVKGDLAGLTKEILTIYPEAYIPFQLVD